eukprot:g3045.t1
MPSASLLSLVLCLAAAVVGLPAALAATPVSCDACLATVEQTAVTWRSVASKVLAAQEKRRGKMPKPGAKLSDIVGREKLADLSREGNEELKQTCTGKGMKDLAPSVRNGCIAMMRSIKYRNALIDEFISSPAGAQQLVHIKARLCVNVVATCKRADVDFAETMGAASPECKACRSMVSDVLFGLRVSRLGRHSKAQRRELVDNALEKVCAQTLYRHASESPSRYQEACDDIRDQLTDDHFKAAMAVLADPPGNEDDPQNGLASPKEASDSLCGPAALGVCPAAAAAAAAAKGGEKEEL